jgi:thioredoxin reductase
MKRDYEVVIVGAGPSGLAAAKLCKDAGLSYIVFDQASAVASIWATFWDSFRLGMPAKDLFMSGMEDLVKDFGDDAYLTRDEVFGLFQKYAAKHDLNIQLNTKVDTLEKQGAHFVAKTSIGIFTAKHLVMCIGPRQQAKFPESSVPLWGHPSFLHSSQYQNLDGVSKDKPVFVAGSGLSAMSVAYDVREQGYDLELGCSADDKKFKENNPQIDEGFLAEYMPSHYAAVPNYGRLNYVTPETLTFNGKTVRVDDYSRIILATGYTRVSLLYKHLDGENGFYRVGMEDRQYGEQTINEGARQARIVVKDIRRARHMMSTKQVLAAGVFGEFTKVVGRRGLSSCGFASDERRARMAQEAKILEYGAS